MAMCSRAREVPTAEKVLVLLRGSAMAFKAGSGERAQRWLSWVRAWRGLNAAAALCGSGADVTVLERRPYVGGRAYSYLHPALDEVVDSQHVLLGCCTNLIDFCEQAGVADKVRWYDKQTFLEPADAKHKVDASDIVRGRAGADAVCRQLF